MTTSTKGLLWTVPLAGFANPRYLAADPTDATGFDITGNAGYTFAFDGNTAVPTIVHEQTFDPTGVTGWFGVVGKTLSSGAGIISASMATLATPYFIPAIGQRARMRVTALTTADLLMRMALVRDFIDMATASGIILGTGSSAIGSLSSGTAIIGGVVASASSSIGVGSINAKIKAAASNNLTSVKASAGRLMGYAFYNSTAAAKFVKLYNKASAPVVATDAALILATIIVPANGNAIWSGTVGKAFSTGIAYAITGAVGEADVTNTAVDDVTGHLDYI